MFLTSILILITIILLHLSARSRQKKLNLFNELGIAGPKPNVVFGNLHSLSGKKYVETLSDWTKEYGKIYGYYEGSSPVIVTSDPDVIKEVFVKQFNNFYGRRLLPVQPEPDTGADRDVHILFSRGHRWKRLRSTISPSFSSAKIKSMMPLIKCCINETMTILERKSAEGESFDIHSVLQGLTIDVIGTCAFGLEPQFQKNRDEDPFIIRCQRLFTDFAKRPFIVILGAIFPELSRFWWKLCKLVSAYTYDDMDWLFTNLGSVIDKRKSHTLENIRSENTSQYKRVDLLQILLDAEVGSGSAKGSTVAHLTMRDSEEDHNSNYEMDSNVNFSPEISSSSQKYLTSQIEHKQLESASQQDKWSYAAGATSAKPKTRLSLDEVKASSVVFLIAGYETLSNLLAYVVYELAVNPHCQKKLQLEIDNTFDDVDDLCYDKLSSLKYLDMIISETLRKYPIASLLTGRLCMNTTEVSGYTIPQGTTVQPDIWSLHYSAEHWGPEDPQQFHPDRFLPECVAKRHPMAYMPFGAGPKNCIGMRFAMTECKITLATLFKKFNILPSEQTKIPCELIETASLSPKDGVVIKLEPRSS
ncbi:TBXAS1 [Bugula neritina]|uniref:TBXAS1 n=1 Tax=Bugula neritina TaxID=10212 RepID=A0A7J7JBR3_BUGNE|nr:TBXAS1 [Bugula neritina]